MVTDLMTESEAHELFRSAWSAYDDGKSRDAISLLENAISGTTNHKAKSVYLATLGMFLEETNELERAATVCKEAIDLVPKNADAHTQMGIVKLKLGDDKAAAHYFERSAALSPTPEIWTFLGRAQLSSDAVAAKASALKALALDPEWEEAKSLLIAAEAGVSEYGTYSEI